MATICSAERGAVATARVSFGSAERARPLNSSDWALAAISARPARTRNRDAQSRRTFPVTRPDSPPRMDILDFHRAFAWHCDRSDSTLACSWIAAPADSAARARPLTSIPGFTDPPGTSPTARRFPSSVQSIGESASRRNVRFQMRREDPTRSQFSGRAGFPRTRRARLPVRGIRGCRFGQCYASGAAARAKADACGFENGDAFAGRDAAQPSAAERPVNPPPTTAKSVYSGSGWEDGWKSIVHGGTPHKSHSPRSLSVNFSGSFICGRGSGGNESRLAAFRSLGILSRHYPPPEGMLPYCCYLTMRRPSFRGVAGKTPDGRAQNARPGGSLLKPRFLRLVSSGSLRPAQFR